MMNYSRASFLLWGGFIGLAAFVVGRTTAPSGVAASSSNSGAGSAESNRQIAIAVKKEVEESMKNRMPKLIEEGIIAVEKREEEAIRAARNNSVQSVLQTVRAQLELFKLQHSNRYPTFNDMRDWLALTGKTDAEGRISDKGEYGPYVQAPVSNPLTGKTKVAASGQATKEAGWAYDEKTGQIHAVITHAALDAAGPEWKNTAGEFEFAPEN